MPDTLFSTAEIEIIRLAGWLKGIPLNMEGFDTGLFSTTEINDLCHYKLLYITKNKRYLRLTPAGWDLLYQLGYSYPKDACYITDKQKLQRRDEAAKILFTTYRAGINVFADTPSQLSKSPMYLSSAAARRNTAFTGSKVWAGCRMAGIVKLGQTAYLVHFMDGQGILFQSETLLFNKLVAGRCEKTAAIYAADSYLDAAREMLLEPIFPDDKRRANGWFSFAQTAKSLLVPLHLLECSDTGAYQLALMNLPDYQDKLAQLALLEDYYPAPDHLPDIDAFSKSLGLPLMVAIDMDIKRLERAANATIKNNYPKLMVLALEAQFSALTLALSVFGLESMADFYTLSQDLFTEQFDLRLYEPPDTPYQTPEGGYLNAASLNLSRKMGGAAKPEF